MDIAPGASPDRVCVLILGMHRSGTSAAARLVSLIGASLPRHLMDASGSNLAGHWEPKLLVELHDRFLFGARSAWNDWRPFVPEAALPPQALEHFRGEIRRTIVEEFAGERLFVLKDPRISRFAPFYLEVLASLGVTVKVVIILRHPMEVAASLEKRDEMPTSDALLLWLRHSLDAEAGTRGVDRVILSYDALMRDPDASIRRLQTLVSPGEPSDSHFDSSAARASLRGELRHHSAEAITCPGLPMAADWASEAQTAFLELEHDEASADARSRVDKVRFELDADARAHGDRVAYLIAVERRASAEIDDLTRQRDIIVERHNDVAEDYRLYRRDRIAQLAATKRYDFKIPKEVPIELSPWRAMRLVKRRKIRQRLHDYVTLLASPLFDSEFYLTTYPDVGSSGFPPALHYLLHGSDEGRQPSAIVNAEEILEWFPDLRGLPGNLVLNLIDLHTKPTGSP